MAKTCRKNSCDAIISEILPRGDKLNKKAQEVNTALHELCESENQWIIKHQSFKSQYHLNRNTLHPNYKGPNMIGDNFKKFFNDWLINTRNFGGQNFADNMKKPGIHFDNSNLDEYDIGYLVTFTKEILNGKLLFCAVRLALKDKCVYSIDAVSATEMCGNADQDSYDDYDDDSINVSVSEHSSRDKVNANKSLSKLKEKTKKIFTRHSLIAQLNIINSLRNKFQINGISGPILTW